MVLKKNDDVLHPYLMYASADVGEGQDQSLLDEKDDIY